LKLAHASFVVVVALATACSAIGERPSKPSSASTPSTSTSTVSAAPVQASTPAAQATTRPAQEPQPRARAVRQRDLASTPREQAKFTPRLPFPDPLPPVQGDLKLVFDPTKPPTMLDLVRAYEALTDMRFIMRDEHTAALKSLRLDITAPLDVAAKDVASTVQSLLVQHRFVLTILHRGEPFLASIDARQPGDGSLYRALMIDERDLSALERLPALMVALTVRLENLTGTEALNVMNRYTASANESGPAVTSSGHALLVSASVHDLTAWLTWLRVMDRSSVDEEASMSSTSSSGGDAR